MAETTPDPATSAGTVAPHGTNGTARETTVSVGTAEWDRLTERRAELIDKKHEEGLTDAEGEEYERLQRISRKAISVAFPRPVFQPLPTLTEE
ncbi:MAG: hypothetical protein ACRC33_04220 [Gemmataceae bacterium]